MRRWEDSELWAVAALWIGGNGESTSFWLSVPTIALARVLACPVGEVAGTLLSYQRIARGGHRADPTRKDIIAAILADPLGSAERAHRELYRLTGGAEGWQIALARAEAERNIDTRTTRH